MVGRVYTHNGFWNGTNLRETNDYANYGFIVQVLSLHPEGCLFVQPIEELWRKVRQDERSAGAHHALARFKCHGLEVVYAGVGASDYHRVLATDLA